MPLFRVHFPNKAAGEHMVDVASKEWFARTKEDLTKGPATDRNNIVKRTLQPPNVICARVAEKMKRQLEGLADGNVSEQYCNTYVKVLNTILAGHFRHGHHGTRRKH